MTIDSMIDRETPIFQPNKLSCKIEIYGNTKRSVDLIRLWIDTLKKREPTVSVISKKRKGYSATIDNHAFEIVMRQNSSLGSSSGPCFHTI